MSPVLAISSIKTQTSLVFGKIPLIENLILSVLVKISTDLFSGVVERETKKNF